MGIFGTKKELLEGPGGDVTAMAIGGETKGKGFRQRKRAARKMARANRKAQRKVDKHGGRIEDYGGTKLTKMQQREADYFKDLRQERAKDIGATAAIAAAGIATAGLGVAAAQAGGVGAAISGAGGLGSAIGSGLGTIGTAAGSALGIGGGTGAGAGAAGAGGSTFLQQAGKQIGKQALKYAGKKAAQTIGAGGAQGAFVQVALAQPGRGSHLQLLASAIKQQDGASLEFQGVGELPNHMMADIHAVAGRAYGLADP